MDSLSIEEYCRTLRERSRDIPFGVWRLRPTSFGFSEKVDVFPQDPSVQWHLIEHVLSTSSESPILSALPALWQTETIVHASCRRYKRAPFFVAPHNHSLARASIESLSVDTVIISAEHVHELVAQISSRSVRLPSVWVIVRSLSQLQFRIPEALTQARSVFQEIHLFPGVPLFSQCEMLAQSKSEVFHLVSDYSWELTSTTTHISSTTNMFVPFQRLVVPVKLAQQHHQCTCTQPAYSFVI